MLEIPVSFVHWFISVKYQLYGIHKSNITAWYTERPLQPNIQDFNWISLVLEPDQFTKYLGDIKGFIPDRMTKYFVWPSVRACYSEHCACAAQAAPGLRRYDALVSEYCYLTARLLRRARSRNTSDTCRPWAERDVCEWRLPSSSWRTWLVADQPASQAPLCCCTWGRQHPFLASPYLLSYHANE